MSFTSDLQRFADHAGENINEVRRGVAVDIFSKVIMRTPVDTGRARGNWQATLTTPAPGTLETTDTTGSSAISRAVRVANAANQDQTIWLTNNLPYIGRLEYEGWSNQAPNGMVRLSIQEFRRALDIQLRKLK